MDVQDDSESSCSKVPAWEPACLLKGQTPLEIEGYPIEGLSIGGHETCVIFPSIKVVFDMGRCPERAISQDFVFITHGHIDHIGGLPTYVAIRGMYRRKPPTIIVPKVIEEDVKKLFELYRALDQSEMKHNVIGLDVGEEFELKEDLIVKTFRTYHQVPSQGYVIYSVRKKLKQEYSALSGNEIKSLRESGLEVTCCVASPEIAFTGDTKSEFITDPDNADILRARILVMESTFLDNANTVEDARAHGHIHLSEVVHYAEKFKNKAILLMHFSARYRIEDIMAAMSNLPPILSNRVHALTEGFGLPERSGNIS